MSRTVLITGCSSGFGRTAARAFHKAGWNVVATMRDPTRWQNAEVDDFLVTHLDVCNLASIQGALAQAAARFDHVDCVVNNAGQALLSVFEATPFDAIRTLFETNFFGMAQVMQAVIPHFHGNRGGRIVNVSSGSAIVLDPLMAAYAASKWAVEGLTEGLRYELETQNITVKLVEPGFVPSTNLVPKTQAAAAAMPIPSSYQAFVDQTLAMLMGGSPYQLATEEDVAEAIVAAASDDTGRLRYVVGEDTKASAHMRRETSEDAYMAWTRERYAAKP